MSVRPSAPDPEAVVAVVAALKALMRYHRLVARDDYSEWHDGKRVFNDTIWAADNPRHYQLYAQARAALAALERTEARR